MNHSDLKDLKNQRSDQLVRCGRGFVHADLKAYLDGELRPPRRWVVSFHLSRCTECREEIAWLQRLGKNMRSLEAAYPRPELRQRILSTLPAMEMQPQSGMARMQPSVNRPVHVRFRGPSLAAAGALLIAALAFGAVAFVAHQSAQNAADFAKTHSAQPVATSRPVRLPKSPATHDERQGPNVPIPDDIVKPDPTSEAADQLATLKMEKMRQDAQKTIPANLERAFAEVKSRQLEVGSSTTPYVSIALDSKDVASARRTLTEWAEKSHFKYEVISGAGEGGAQIAVHVPSNAGGGVLSALRKLGDIAEISTQSITGATKSGQHDAGKKAPAFVPTSASVPASDDRMQNIKSGLKSNFGAGSDHAVTKKATADTSTAVANIFVLISIRPAG